MKSPGGRLLVDAAAGTNPHNVYDKYILVHVVKNAPIPNADAPLRHAVSQTFRAVWMWILSQ